MPDTASITVAELKRAALGPSDRLALEAMLRRVLIDRLKAAAHEHPRS